MQGITYFCDEAACFLVDPLNAKFSTEIKCLACATTIFLAIATRGIVQVVCILWRQIHVVEENETLKTITQFFVTNFYNVLDAGDVFDDETDQPHSEQFYEDSSRYEIVNFWLWIDICVDVVRKGLKEHPEFHLQKLAESIDQGVSTHGILSLGIKFLRDDLKPILGIDVGGPARDFLDDLFEGILQNSQLCFKDLSHSSLVLPQTRQQATDFQSLPPLNDEELSLYHGMGKVMMYCYCSEILRQSQYLIGRRFDDALFKAILLLTAEEIDSPFDALALPTKLKMCQAMLQGHEEGGMDLSYLQQRLDWLQHFDALDDAQLLDAAESVNLSGFLTDSFLTQQEEPDLEKIKQNLALFKECLLNSLFCQQGGHGQFGAQLAPIHAIAKGMKSICNPKNYPQIEDNAHWDHTISLLDYQEFSNIIQGFLNREKIAKLLQPDNWLGGTAKIEIEKKTQWLQEWIKDDEKGATEDELRNLLKFLIGSTGFQQNASITVKSQSGPPYFPVPTVDACFFNMGFAPVDSQYGSFNDHTKENFIESLKELALRNPGRYHVG